MTAADFLAVFFNRGSKVVRERYGDSSYIDVSGNGCFAIRDHRGRTLGEGHTLREAMAAADKTVLQGVQGTTEQATVTGSPSEVPTRSAPLYVRP